MGPKKILQLLRLRQLHNGVFVKLNKATWNMLRMIEPFVTYGFPSRHTIEKLIYKRGHGKVDRCRIPLSDNAIVESVLGKSGLHCVEDVIQNRQLRSKIQGGQQLPLAIQAQLPSRWI